jgi:MFS family permease
MINSLTSRSEILWRQIWGLAALLAAIIFSWMAYRIYQPKILQKLDFVELTAWLGIMQGLLAAFIEPLIGAFSDRIQRNLGSRLPMISVGVILAGVIFAATSLLVQQNLQGGIRWILPVLMTVWVMAIIAFRSPAIALLRQFAPVAELPQANAVLLIVFGLIGAIAPVLDDFLKKIGASITFMLGAIALIIGACILQSFTPVHKFDPSTLDRDAPCRVSPQLLALIFVVGLGAGFEVNLLMSIFPKVLQAQLPSFKAEYIASTILLLSAIASVPLGKFTALLGADHAMLFGLGTMTGLMGLTLLNDSRIQALGIILAFGVSFGLVFISMIPLALSMLAPSHAGLGTGLYFSGGGAGFVLVSILMKQTGIIPIGAFLLAEVAFLVVVVCIFLSRKIRIV